MASGRLLHCNLQPVSGRPITSYSDVLNLPPRDLTKVLKNCGEVVIGLQPEEKRIRLCNILNISTTGASLSGSDSVSVRALVNKTTTEWTKDIRDIPSISLEIVKRYLLDVDQRVSISDKGAASSTGMIIETFTPESLIRYKTLRSYDLWASGHIHSFEINHLEKETSVCLVRVKSNASWTSGRIYDTCVALDKRTAQPCGAYCYCTAG
jgi:hypothetical protein